MGAQPEQALEGDDGSHPHEGPFLATNVFVVKLGVQVEGQEDGPYNRKRPDVGMEEERPRAEQLGRLDLRAVHESSRRRRRHGEESPATHSSGGKVRN